MTLCGISVLASSVSKKRSAAFQPAQRMLRILQCGVRHLQPDKAYNEEREDEQAGLAL